MARRLERKSLSQTIVVQDVINGGSKGEVANISRQGLMLRSPREIPTEAIFQMRLELSSAIGGSTSIELGADCLWCSPTSSGNHYWAGFQIIDISETASSQIDALISKFGQ